jgi:hypothetical protein
MENIESIATSVGLGGSSNAVGGLLALLMYLQYQGLITVNMAKIESYTDGIVNTLLSRLGIIFFHWERLILAFH